MTALKSNVMVPFGPTLTFENIGSVMILLFANASDCSATALKLAASPLIVMTACPGTIE